MEKLASPFAYNAFQFNNLSELIVFELMRFQSTFMQMKLISHNKRLR